MHTIAIESLPLEIPESIEVDISKLKNIGDAIHAFEIQLPDGVTLKSHPEATVVTVQPPEKEEVVPSAEVPVEGVAPMEPEVIAKGKEKEGTQAPETDDTAKKEAPSGATHTKTKGKEK